MAIALDAVSTGGPVSGTTALTISHTITGSDPFLAVCIFVDGAGGIDNVSGVTWNGSAMSRAIFQGHVPSESMYIYYMAAPATGTHDVVVSVTLSCNKEATVLSYTGVAQSTPIDNTDAVPFTASQNAVSVNFTTTVDNDWGIMWAVNPTSAATLTAGTNFTQRSSMEGGLLKAGDSNAPFTPTGAYAMTVTTGGGGNSFIATGITFKPATAVGPTNVKTWDGTSLSVVKTINGLPIGSVKTVNGVN